MPTMDFKTPKEESVESIYDYMYHLERSLRYIINGGLDDQNIRADSITARVIEAATITAAEIAANTITADKMNVTELSAINANLGTITAGLLNAVTVIGSLIQTQTAGNYPRMELSSTNELLKAEASSTEKLEMIASDGFFIVPMLIFTSGLNISRIYYLSGSLNVVGEGGLFLGASGGDVDIGSGATLARFQGWDRIYNQGAGETLQTALNNKANKGSSTDSHIQGDHNHGFPHGTVFTDKSGVDHTWNASGGFTHSHNQN